MPQYRGEIEYGQYGHDSLMESTGYDCEDGDTFIAEAEVGDRAWYESGTVVECDTSDTGEPMLSIQWHGKKLSARAAAEDARGRV